MDDEGEEIEEDIEMGEDEDMEISIEENESESDNNKELFSPNPEQIKFDSNSLYEKIYNETSIMLIYLEESIKNFYKIFNQKQLKTFNDVLNYLENISIQNKCVCAELINETPAWRCEDCCQYESAIYCSECYKKSKHLHKNHKIYYLYSSGGMCDCGDPDSLCTFCPDHSGPYTNQEEINKYISTIFSEEIIYNLNNFFEEFFFKFTKYFILTEKCDLFCESIFDETFNNINQENQENQNNQENEALNKEKDSILYIKYKFGELFQNLLDFFKQISSKNVGMLNILANHFLKNHFKKENEKENEYETTHTCIKIYENDIKLIENNKNKNSQKHICECCFLRLLLLNWRNNIKSNNKGNNEFLLSFPRNLPLKRAFCILFFYDYNQMMLNNNSSLLNNKSQFFSEEITVLIAKKTTFIEDSFESFYNYFSKSMKSKISKNKLGKYKESSIKKLYKLSNIKEDDVEYFSKPQIRELMGNKISIIKRIIDCICLIHNENEFISIFPHPEFQNKGCSDGFIDLELKLLSIIDKLNILMNWENYDLVKNLFRYIISRVNKQELYEIKQLKENEYSFHLILYRCLGLLINYFCFYYSFKNKCTIIDSIIYFKNNFFIYQEEINTLVDKVLNDYYKLFGFIGGTKNRFFNYYNNIENYYALYLYYQKILKIDFTLLKYLFIMNENNFNLSNYIKKSNVENIYSTFEAIFLNKNDNDNDNNKMIIETDFSKIDNNIINQWKFLLELIISFMKDDSTPFWNFISDYEEIISSKTRNDLFDNIRKNENAMNDLENILKEQIIHVIVSQGNLIDIEKIKKNIDYYLIILFGEKKFKEILEDLTFNKMNKETKLFYLKDLNFIYLDMNYYISPKDKSNAQKYILEFKKDVIKSYNNYYFNPSKLTFDFFKKIYEKIILNKDNLELMILIIDKLLTNSDLKSIKNVLLPSLLNYLSILGCINTKSFIEFKNENKILINKLINILSISLENNQNNKLLDKDLEDYLKEVIHQLKRYEIIENNIMNNKIKINYYEYNTNNIELLNENENPTNKNIQNNNNIIKENKLKSKNMKEHFKNLMKAKTQKFMDKSKLNENILKLLNDQNKKEQNNNNDANEETMCFFCRNDIKLKSFKVPYGKGGFLLKDFFYLNSIKATVKFELFKLNKNKKDNKLYEEIIDNDIIKEKNKRIISCGHYFHQSCFIEHCNNYYNNFNCPLCLKKINILIPPLINFGTKWSFLKSEKISKIFNKKSLIKPFEIEKDSYLFYDIIFNFIKANIDINIKNDKKLNSKSYASFIEEIFVNYKTYINFLENIFFIDGTNFNKQQQIDTIQNYILTLRYLMKINYLDINIILGNIKDILSSLIKGPGKTDKILYNYENNHYINSFEKLMLLLSILFNYKEIKDIFIYIIYLFIPYFSFGFYLRNLMVKNKFYSLYTKKLKEKITMKNWEEFLIANNEYMIKNCLHYFIQKLLIIKFITNYNAINDDILNNFNELSLEKMFSLIELDKLYNLLKNKNKDEIQFVDLLTVIPKLFKTDDIIYKQYIANFKFKKLFESIIDNIKKKKTEKYLIKKEFIIHFLPIKFNFINLEENIFDLVENNLDKKCAICYKLSKHYFICLICGKKICHSGPCNEYNEHLGNCTGNYCIYIDMNDMKLFLCSKEDAKNLYSLYVNEAGVGPSEREIGNEYNLNKEKLKLTLKNFICNDFNFN